MKNKEIKAVIFDLGGVYFKDALSSFSDLSAKEGFSSNRFLDVIRKKYFNKIETGKMLEKEFWHKFKQDVGFKMPIAEAKKYFLSHHKPMPGMKKIVKDLRKKIKVGLLTNNTVAWYDMADKEFKISQDFDSVVVSASVGIRKPDKKIYKLIANKLGVSEKECIFFDDFEENISGAKRAGMNACKFVGIDDLQSKLNDFGLTKKSIKVSRPAVKNRSNVKLQKPNRITFKVNNKGYACLPGTSVLKALGENGIYIPTLCYSPLFPPKANCRLCLVEIKGQNKLATACSNEVKDGMNIFTDTLSVQKARQTNLKLLYQDHIGKCPTCIRLKNCELLRLVSKYQAGSPDFKTSERKFKKDTSGAVVFDFEKCIKCGRCINACKKFGSDVLEFKKKGFETIIGTKNGKKLKDSGCISCKQCAQVCPVGAIYENK